MACDHHLDYDDCDRRPVWNHQLDCDQRPASAQHLVSAQRSRLRSLYLRS